MESIWARSGVVSAGQSAGPVIWQLFGAFEHWISTDGEEITTLSFAGKEMLHSSIFTAGPFAYQSVVEENIELFAFSANIWPNCVHSNCNKSPVLPSKLLAFPGPTAQQAWLLLLLLLLLFILLITLLLILLFIQLLLLLLLIILVILLLILLLIYLLLLLLLLLGPLLLHFILILHLLFLFLLQILFLFLLLLLLFKVLLQHVQL